MEDAVGVVAEPFVASVQPDESVDPIVIRLHVFVADRPVVAESVDGLASEVVGPEAEGDSAPVVRPAPEHPGAPPIELRAWRARVRFTVDLPPAVARVELAEGTTVNS